PWWWMDWRCWRCGAGVRRGLYLLARQLACLLHPVLELLFVEIVVLVDVEVAHVFVLRLARRLGLERVAAQECDLHVPGEAVEIEEPPFPVLRTVERGVPLHGLAHAGRGAFDQLVQALADRPLPAGHRRDVIL